MLVCKFNFKIGQKVFLNLAYCYRFLKNFSFQISKWTWQPTAAEINFGIKNTWAGLFFNCGGASNPLIFIWERFKLWMFHNFQLGKISWSGPILFTGNKYCVDSKTRKLFPELHNKGNPSQMQYLGIQRNIHPCRAESIFFFFKAQPKPQLAGLVLFPINPDKRPLIRRSAAVDRAGKFYFKANFIQIFTKYET